jgi:hypothetical protein
LHGQSLPVGAVLDELWDEPVLLVESSPVVSKALSGVASQALGAFIATKFGHPVLILPYEAGVAVLWFAAGPIIGAREALRRAAEDAVHDVGREWSRSGCAGCLGG